MTMTTTRMIGVDGSPREPVPARETVFRRTPPTDLELAACRVAHELLQYVIRQASTDAQGRFVRSGRTISVGYIDTFLWVAYNEGHAIEDYARMAGVSKSVMSRHILDIGDFNRDRAPGLGWVTSRPNPAFRRRYEVWLTPRGKDMLAQLRHKLDLWARRTEGGGEG